MSATCPCCECCESMEHQLRMPKCKHHTQAQCPDMLIVLSGGNYVMPIKDGGSSFIRIYYCPFCGTKLP
jgi:hypothetical protein